MKRLKAAEAAIRRLVAAEGELTVEAANAAHRAKIADTVSAIAKGAAPATINAVADVDTIAAEFSAKRQALRDERARIVLSTIDDLVTVGHAITSSVYSLRGKLYTAEREQAKAFKVEFRQSEQLLLVYSCAWLIERRFNGIAAAFRRDPIHSGSPATVLRDLLPGIADW